MRIKNFEDYYRRKVIGHAPSEGTESEPFAECMALRALSLMPMTHDLAKAIDHSGPLTHLLGLDPEIRSTTKQVTTALRRSMKHAMSKPAPRGGSVLVENIQKLGEALGLNEPETVLLHFSMLMQNSATLTEALDACRGGPARNLTGFVAAVCGLEVEAVTDALSPRGRLHTSGLVQVDRRMSAGHSVKERLDVMQRFNLMLGSSGFKAEDLLSQCAAIAPAPKLTCEDYPHLSDELEVMRTLLVSAVRQRQTGVNFLLWGPPGTGKTEFARLLGSAAGLHVREVVSDDEEGEAISHRHRATAFGVAQRLLREHDDTVLVFDEMEDLMMQENPFSPQRSNVGKAWFNRQLEQNPVPTIWVTNDADHFDSAILRRFLMVAKFTVPPESPRRRIVARQLKGLELDGGLVDQIAGLRHLPPACIERAVAAARLLPPGSTRNLDQVVRMVINGATEVLDIRGLPTRTAAHNDEVTIPYALKYLNADADLPELVRQVRRCGSARLCLYGAPGTGKSAFARELAKRLKRRLIVRKASDILDKFVGESEQNIAQAFEEATEKQAMLLIDEADSFLGSRKQAVRSWESTLVNEFLVQMETFDGVLVCSTNFTERLDEAAARRFDLQIRFDAMHPDQAWDMFRAVLRKRGLPLPRGKASHALRDRVTTLDGLTPGDFAKALRGARLSGELDTAQGLFESLERVARTRDFTRHGRGIGFISTN